MKRLFADSVFWIALTRPRDPHKQSALKALDRLTGATLTTTEEVLVEVCAALRGNGHLRLLAAELVNKLHDSEEVQVLPQSHETFAKGLLRYAERPNKTYSLTDCISMNTMEDEGIREVLTNDDHFRQEGFVVLMR